MKNFRYYISIFSLLLLLFSFGCNTANGPSYPPGTVKGRILDSATHLPLAGVRITSVPVSSLLSVSDTSGYYVLGGIPMPNSGTYVQITTSRLDYISATVTHWLLAEDTATINFALIPNHGVFIVDNIQIQEHLDLNSNSSINLSSIISKKSNDFDRDLDLLDSAGVRLKFRFVDASKSQQSPVGYETLIGRYLGNFSKSEFDTLAMYYGAGVPLSTADFPNFRTDFFYPNITNGPVFPFYLKGRFESSLQEPKIYGLLYIKSTYLDPSNIFNVIVDVKINKNGQNYFIIKN
jgi:hypothetical protein